MQALDGERFYYKSTVAMTLVQLLFVFVMGMMNGIIIHKRMVEAKAQPAPLKSKSECTALAYKQQKPLALLDNFTISRGYGKCAGTERQVVVVEDSRVKKPTQFVEALPDAELKPIDQLHNEAWGSILIYKVTGVADCPTSYRAVQISQGVAHIYSNVLGNCSDQTAMFALNDKGLHMTQLVQFPNRKDRRIMDVYDMELAPRILK